MNNRWNLKNKKARVTGGTKGIGKAIVKEFIDLGAEVIVVARNKSEFITLQKDLNTDKISFIEADVSSIGDINKIFYTIEQKGNSLDILVNNAGTNVRKKTIEYTNEEFDTIVNTNLRSAFELSKLAYPLLKKSEQGNIINIS